MTEVRVEVDGGVAMVTLAAPQRRNALTGEMVRELVDACDRLDADPAVGAVVIGGEGDAFCAGAHRATLADAGRDPADPTRYEAMAEMYAAFVRVGALRMPTVAAVRGAAVGAGVNLMLATDVRVVAEDARIVPGFVGLGLHPGGGHFALLGRLAGPEAAAAMTVFGEEVDGRRAAQLGVAWIALPRDEVDDRALAMARNAARDPELARAVIRSLRLELGPPPLGWPAALELERAQQMWSLRRRALREESET